MMNHKFRKFQSADKDKILNILEYYTENSFAAYPESFGQKDHFDGLFDAADNFSFYVFYIEDQIVGIGLLWPINKLTTLRRPEKLLIS